MIKFESAFFPIKDFKEYRMINQGNIDRQGKYGKDKRGIFYIVKHMELQLLKSYIKPKKNLTCY